MAFESLTLTPFCMEILGVRKWIFQCFNSVFSAIVMESGKNMQEHVHFLYFYNCFADIPCFVFQGRDQLLGRAGQENISPGISPRISPLLDF